MLLFTLANTWDASLTTDQNALTANIFTQMGILGGPAKNQDGSTNEGSIVTLTFAQFTTDFYGLDVTVLARVSIDLTHWVPGQFYWGPPLSNPVSVWGNLKYSDQNYLQYYYGIYAYCSTPYYSVYTMRPCTLLNGQQWGSDYSTWNIPNANNDHCCYGGSVDLTSVNPQDLSTAFLTPTVAFSGQVRRRGDLGALPGQPEVGLRPQIQLVGQPRRAGAFDLSSMMVKPVLNATSMAGGPLWKPAKLCSG